MALFCPKVGVHLSLHEDRKKHDFIGKHLPFTLSDNRICEPVRYYLGDDWLDLMVLYYPGWGWEVHVLAQSSDDFDLGDVYLDLKEQVRAELAVQPKPAESALPAARLNDIVTRLEQLERLLQKPVEAKQVESPYLNAQEAAAYLRINVNALYSLVERRKLRPLPGYRKYRFTKEMLDAYLRGGH
jgi:excisionase family DNA binding protein